MDEQKSTELRLWEHERNHVYLLAHDGLNFKNYLKKTLLPPKYTLLLIVGLSLFAAVMSAFFGLFSNNFSDMFVLSFIGWMIFFAVEFGVTFILNYYLYLNETKDDNSIYMGVAIAIAVFILHYYFRVNGNGLLIATLLVTYLTIKITKSIYYEENHPKPLH